MKLSLALYNLYLNLLEIIRFACYSLITCRLGEMVDTKDSKSFGSDPV